MKIFKTALVFALFILCTANGFTQRNLFSQRLVLTDEDEVSATVTKEINDVFQAADFVKRKSKKFAEECYGRNLVVS